MPANAARSSEIPDVAAERVRLVSRFSYKSSFKILFLQQEQGNEAKPVSEKLPVSSDIISAWLEIISRRRHLKETEMKQDSSLFSLQIHLPAVSTASARRICWLARDENPPVLKYDSIQMRAWPWLETPSSDTKAIVLYQLLTTTNKHTVWSDSVWPLGTRRGMFHWRFESDQNLHFKEARSFQWRQILWINSTSTHSGSLSFCSLHTEIIIYTFIT